MRYIISFFIITLFSCSEKTGDIRSGYFSNVQFSLDTVIIDPGINIIFLEYDLLNADKSIDDKYLFNFNMDDHSLEKINLNTLRLEEKLPFEKEGPNGTGPSFGGLKIRNENQFTIGGMNRTELFSLNGEKLKTIRYDSFFLESNPSVAGEFVSPITFLEEESNRLYVLIDQKANKSYAFGILHLDNYEIIRMPLKTFEDLYDYGFTFFMGQSSIGFGPGKGIDMFGTKLVLSNQITSALMVYDTEMDSLYTKDYCSKLIADKKVRPYQLEHETEESLEAEYSRFHQEINFLAPFWDEKNQVFYRFAYQEMPSESKEDVQIKSKIYLTVLDKDLNLIGETLVPQLTKKPAKPFSRQFPKHFAKDGKIWIYENINDEMGFAVLTISKKEIG
ncbi:DUF4221 family protein [Mongoliibacter sp.]|uniref:DUF4221 family protein n=1 Tax=Mongoliibacter sp. TaxID=2022438 RepID=UPI0026008183|nr:DUF4221 family protein [Mongoliibacter sp.]